MESIDLISFLSNYYGIVNNSLKLNKLTHIDVKILFPNIKRTSFEKVNNNIASIYKGDIIMVYDAKGKILPYINPHLQISENLEKQDIYEDDELINIDYIDLDSLSKDELLTLRKKLKKNKQYKEEKKVEKAIVRKKDYQVME